MSTKKSRPAAGRKQKPPIQVAYLDLNSNHVQQLELHGLMKSILALGKFMAGFGDKAGQRGAAETVRACGRLLGQFKNRSNEHTKERVQYDEVWLGLENFQQGLVRFEFKYTQLPPKDCHSGQSVNSGLSQAPPSAESQWFK
jgi:hypothetical protein